MLREAALATIEQHDAAAQKMLDLRDVCVERLQARSASKKPRRIARKARDDAELAATALTPRTLKASDRVTPTSPLFVLAEPLPPLPHHRHRVLTCHPGLDVVLPRKSRPRSCMPRRRRCASPRCSPSRQRVLETFCVPTGCRWGVRRCGIPSTATRWPRRPSARSSRPSARASRPGATSPCSWKALAGVEQARRQFLAMALSLSVADEVLRLRTRA